VTAPVGSAAEEAAKLFAAAEEWVRTRAGTHLDGMATGAPECSFCPLCQGISAVRSVRPETVEHLLDAAASFVAALRSAVVTETQAEATRRAGVQRIDVQEV
jgi:hypothetical protein